MSSIPVIQTSRLRLRPFAPDDAPRVRELAGAREVAATTLNIPHPYPEGAGEAWIGGHEAAAESGDAFAWAVTRGSDGALLGAISLGVNRRHARGGLGYWLGVPYWNQGYTTEAARAVMEHGFRTLGLNRVEIWALPRNVGSCRVAEKAGLAYEGTLHGYIRKDGVFEDIAVYGRIRADAG